MQFLNSVGALGARQPSNSGSAYFCLARQLSFFVLMPAVGRSRDICCTAGDVGAYESNRDGGVLAKSSTRKALDTSNLDLPRDKPPHGTPELGKCHSHCR